MLSGRASVRVDERDFGTVGLRRSPFDSKPFAVYVPAGAELRVTAETDCELADC